MKILLQFFIVNLILTSLCFSSTCDIKTDPFCDPYYSSTCDPSKDFNCDPYYNAKCNPDTDPYCDPAYIYNCDSKIDPFCHPELALSINDLVVIADNISHSIEDAVEKETPDFQKILPSVLNFDKLVDSAIKSGATKDDLDNFTMSSKHILKTLDLISQKITKPQEAQTLAVGIGSVVTAGIKSAIHSKADVKVVEKIVSDVGEVTKKALENSVTGAGADVTDSLVEVLQGSGKGIHKITSEVTQLSTEEVASKEMVKTISDTLQSSVSTVLDTTSEKLDTVETTPISKVSLISSNISNIVSPLLKISDSGLQTGVVEQAKKVADKALNLSLEEILSSFADTSVKDNITDIVRKNPDVMRKILRSVSVDITTGLERDNSSKANLINQLDSTLDETLKNQILSALPDIADAAKPVINDNSSLLDSGQIVVDVLKKLGFNVEINNGHIGEAIFKVSDNISIVTMISEVKVLPSTLSDGLYPFPNGKLLLVRNGLGIIANPGPVDSINFAKALLASSSSTEVNATLKINSTGSLLYSIGGGKKIAAGFGYLLNQNQNTLSDSSISFQLSGTDPASAAYSLLVEYEDGSFQSLPPVVSEEELFEQELKKFFNNNYKFDKETGVVDLGDIGKLKADYFVADPTSEEITYFNENKDDIGVAWLFVTQGEDGSSVFKMITEKSAQIIYYTP